MKIHRLFVYIIFFLFVVSDGAFAQNEISEDIKDIRKKYAIISKEKATCKIFKISVLHDNSEIVIKNDFKGVSVESNYNNLPEKESITFYFKDDKLRLIEVKEHYGDDSVEDQDEDVEMNEEGVGQNISQFFYWNGKLFFSFVQSEFTHFQMGNLKTVTENRYYYKDDKVIKCLEKYGEGRTSKVYLDDIKNNEIECKNSNLTISKSLLDYLEIHNIQLK